MDCPSCGRAVPAGTHFCGWCGTPLAPAGPEPQAEHPSATGWRPAPLPRRRGVGAGIVAVLLAGLLIVGGGGLFLARSASARPGAGSPEAAVDGLLGALGHYDLKRAAGFLSGEEQQAFQVYGDRLSRALAKQVATPPGANPLAAVDLSFSDVTLRKVDGAGGTAVVEITGGSVAVKTPQGVRIQVPLEEAKRRLAGRTGQPPSLRVVTVRSGGRWFVSLMATAAEAARQLSGSGPANYASLADRGGPAGSASPDAAVRALVAAASGTPATPLERLAPDERAVARAYLATVLAGKGGPPWLHQGTVRIEGLGTRVEQLSDGVDRVYLSGTVRAGNTGRAVPLRPEHAGEPQPYLVAIRSGGSWYPSLLFTMADYAVTEAEGAHR